MEKPQKVSQNEDTLNKFTRYKTRFLYFLYFIQLMISELIIFCSFYQIILIKEHLPVSSLLICCLLIFLKYSSTGDLLLLLIMYFLFVPLCFIPFSFCIKTPCYHRDTCDNIIGFSLSLALKNRPIAKWSHQINNLFQCPELTLFKAYFQRIDCCFTEINVLILISNCLNTL